jgi:RND family efflux transporter MFP subunit
MDKTLIRKVFLWVIAIAAVVAAGSGGYLYYTRAQAADEVTAEPDVQTATVRRGSLVISASGTGTVISDSELQIGFDESGVLTELLVAVGDKVKKGDVLARLQTNNTSEDIASNIANARLNLLQAQANLDDLVSADKSQELAQAELNVIEAEQNLTDMQEARERLNYQRCLDSTIQSYEAQYLMAKNNYEKQKDRYNSEFAPLSDSDPARLNALASLLDAQEKMQKAYANYNWCTGSASKAEIAEADAQVALAQASLNADQKTVLDLQNYPDSLDIAITQAKVDAAQAALEQAQETQSVLELTAPMDGTVMDISGVVGENIGTGGIITLADLEHPVLEVYLDESDLNNVGVGYETDVVFDALPDQTFTGHILSVNPSLTTMQNVTAVRALAQLDPESFAKPQTLPLGLNASVEVIMSKAENVLLVPVEALVDISEGKYAVFVMENGEPKLRTVTVGLMDYTYAEIKDGLSEGDVVTTGIVETSQ